MEDKLKQLGVKIVIEKGYIVIKPPDGINFWDIYMALGKLIQMSEFQDKNDIWVFRKGAVDIDYPDLNKIKEIGNKFYPKNAKGKKTAIVIETESHRKLAELYIDLSGEHSRKIRIFSDFKSAEHWIYHTTIFTRFYGRMAGRFAVDVLWDDLLAKFLSRIPDGGTLLEVGAGPGLLARRILETRPKLKIILTDYSPKMLDLAIANLAKVSHNIDDIAVRPAQVEFAQANAMDLSNFANRKINGIYSMGAIKHFPEPLNCLYQAIDVLADGGIMYFADSCADGSYSGTLRSLRSRFRGHGH